MVVIDSEKRLKVGHIFRHFQIYKKVGDLACKYIHGTYVVVLIYSW